MAKSKNGPRHPTRISNRLAAQISSAPPKPPPAPKKSRYHDGKYHRTATEHFQELIDIWTLDRRIPTAKSRRAWCMARNLNPEVVNAWWYRRKTIAKKLGMDIPGGTYDLPIGNPPVIKVECDEDLTLVKEEPDQVDIPGLKTAYMRRMKDWRSASPDDDTLWDDGIPSSDGFSIDVYSSDTAAPSEGYGSSPPPEEDAYNHRNMPPPPVPSYARPLEDIAAKIGPLTMDSDWIRLCQRRARQDKYEGRLFCNQGRSTATEADGEIFTCLLCLKSPVVIDHAVPLPLETWHLEEEYATFLPQYPLEDPNEVKKEGSPSLPPSVLPFLSLSPDFCFSTGDLSDGYTPCCAIVASGYSAISRTMASSAGILEAPSLVVSDSYVLYELEGEGVDYLPSISKA
ncbi:hypothetical protein BDN72DRAFT_843583 [Pluteus cervinus]|uniref:Uncharacterized protein n=1 Tax=Pluteus cervinus TaxID=181527 RepID=A0ACD3AMN7_9AGAR|nr:hypothetical protein BDN72DRAFT_843583 [Pluteus cervinus]